MLIIFYKKLERSKMRETSENREYVVNMLSNEKNNKSVSK